MEIEMKMESGRVGNRSICVRGGTNLLEERPQAEGVADRSAESGFCVDGRELAYGRTEGGLQ